MMRQFIVVSVSLAVCVNIYFLASPDSFPSMLFAVVAKNDRKAVEHPGKIDNFLRQAAPEGNVYIRFENFDRNREIGEKMIPLVYFRAVYFLHPRKVFVCGEDTVVNEGWEPAFSRFEPSREWLIRNNVRTILVFGCDDEGRIRTSVENVGEGD